MEMGHKKNKFDYFEAYAKQVGFAKELTLNLGSAIGSGELGSYDVMRALHVIENDADAVNHEIQEHLLRDFVVPMERGSMAELAHALDDLCDSIEQIAIDSYTRKAETLDFERPFGMVKLLSMLEQAMMYLASAVELLGSYDKKYDEIKKLCVEAHDCESKADAVYMISVRELYEDDSLSDRELRIMHELLEAVEHAIDTVEDVSEMVELIIAESV